VNWGTYLQRHATPVIDGAQKALTRVITDANFCKDAEDGVSVSGLLIFYKENLIHWRSHKQTAVAVSTAEAELAALREGLMSNIILRDLLAEIGEYPTPNPMSSRQHRSDQRR
jgi:hypothetical protein